MRPKLSLMLVKKLFMRSTERRSPSPAPPENKTSPACCAISRNNVNSYSALVAKSLTAWKIPPPARFIPSAIALYSSILAYVPGTQRPSGTTCNKMRDVEKPTAPPATDSSAMSAMRPSSSGVGSSSLNERSPMTCERIAQWPTKPTTFNAGFSRCTESRYSG